MFGYVCFYKGKRIEVRALRTIDAQEAARVIFQRGSRAKVKAYEITVMLAERPDGSTVIHTAT